MSSSGLTKTGSEKLLVLVAQYVQARAAGHTTKYAIDLLKRSGLKSPPETDEYRRTLFEKLPDLPRHWVKESPFQAATTGSTNLSFYHDFIVADGELAWVYSVPLLVGGPLRVYRVDAQTFDPKLRAHFETARHEAEQAFRGRGITNLSAYFRSYEKEVNSILRSSYGIKVRSFDELNPNIRAD